MTTTASGATTASEDAAMRRALALAAGAGRTLPNPQVGCVLLADDGSTVAEGWHRGAGTPHAEADALRAAGDRARGTTAVVTLEPCNHTGRTGPCAEALLGAGVRRVVFAQTDPNPAARGGAATLRAGGVEVVGGLRAEEAAALNRRWTHAVVHGRPFVTWKLATTLDGRSAAADGTSRWITSAAARRDVHRLRAEHDAVLVGTGTAVVDDPRLTVRDDDGRDLDRAAQPLRAVVGERPLPPGLHLRDDAAETVVLPTREPAAALAALAERERRAVLLEGGPTLAAAFLRAGLVDEVVAYVAPVLLGAGTPTLGDLGIATIADAVRLELREVTVLPASEDDPRPTDVRLTLAPVGAPTPRTGA